jgi:hypothetical protein
MWETLEIIDNIKTERMAVPQGWIVRSSRVITSYEQGGAIHQIFIADPCHVWKPQ